MSQATITARIDSIDKKNFDSFCTNVGITASSAINMFIKAVLREDRIPFDIAQEKDPFFSKSNMAHVKKSVQELRAGKGTVHELIDVDDE